MPRHEALLESLNLLDGKDRHVPAARETPEASANGSRKARAEIAMGQGGADRPLLPNQAPCQATSRGYCYCSLVTNDLTEPVKKRVGGTLTRLPPLQRLEMLRRNALMLRGGRWAPPRDDGTLVRKVVGLAR